MTRASRRLEVVALPAALVLLAACGDLGTEPGVRASAATASAVTYYGSCGADLGEAALLATGWKKVFEDDFAAAALDGRWKIWNGGAFNNELQLYQAANLSLAGGQLSVNARPESKDGPVDPWSSTTKTFSYTSGRIESATTFSAGRTTAQVRMAARILMPSSYGLWPAFWSYGDPWPTQGEIDVVEARSQAPAVYQTNYFYGRRSGVNLVSGKEGFVNLWSTATMATCPHIYEVVWAKNSLTFLLDGVVVDTKAGDYIPNMFGKKQKVVLNLAVGGNFLAPLTQPITGGTMVVDWVKVFTRN